MKTLLAGLGLMTAGLLCWAAPLAAETILYDKDFKDVNATGWKTGALSYSPSAVLTNGEYQLSGRGMVYYAPGLEWKDYIVEFETVVRRWNGNEEGDWKKHGHRLLFRVKDDKTYYMLQISESGLVLQEVGGGMTNTTADITFIRNKVNRSTWWNSYLKKHELDKLYKIKIIVQGDKVTVFEDGNQVMECTLVNDLIEKGSIGIGTIWACGSVCKIKVTGLSPSDTKKEVSPW